MVKNKLKLISMVVMSTFILTACNSGNSSANGGNQASTASFEADTVNGKISEVRQFISGQDGKRILVWVGHPHGRTFAAKHSKDLNKITHTYSSMGALNADKPKLDSSYRHIAELASATNNAISTKAGSTVYSGFDLGITASTGASVEGSGSVVSPDNPVPVCYNYMPQLQSSTSSPGITGFAQFNTTNSDSTFSSTLNLKASISGSYGLFKGNDKFNYDTNYSGSYSTGQNNFFSYFALNTSFSTTQLSESGNALFNSNPVQFAQTCGTSYISSEAIGVSNELSTTITSSSSNSSTSISDTLNASYGFATFTGELTTLSNNANENFNLATSYVSNGDYIFNNNYKVSNVTISIGSSYENIISTWVSSNESGAASCNAQITQASAKQCGKYLTDLGNFISGLTSAVGADIQESGYPKEMGLFEQFPNGVTVLNAAGDGTPPASLTTQPVSGLSNESSSYTDAYKPYAINLQNHVQLIYNLTSLAGRAQLYANLLTSTTLSGDTMNIQGELEALAKSYVIDYSNLESEVTSCLDNVTNCSQMTQISTSDPYTFYSGTTPYTVGDRLWADKLWNSIILQYSGTYTESGQTYSPGLNALIPIGNSAPMAVFYVSNNNTSGSQQQPGLTAIALSQLIVTNFSNNNGFSPSVTWPNVPDSAPVPGAFVINYPILNTSSSIAQQQAALTTLLNNGYANQQSMSNLFSAAPIKYLGGQQTVDTSVPSNLQMPINNTSTYFSVPGNGYSNNTYNLGELSILVSNPNNAPFQYSMFAIGPAVSNGYLTNNTNMVAGCYPFVGLQDNGVVGPYLCQAMEYGITNELQLQAVNTPFF